MQTSPSDIALVPVVVDRLAELLRRGEENIAQCADAALINPDYAHAFMVARELLEADVATWEKLAEGYQAKARQLRERQERMERALVAAMHGTGCYTLEATSGPKGTRVGRVTLVDGVQRAECQGEPPVAFTRVIAERHEWDKAAVKVALDRGEQVVNAKLTRGEPYLRWTR